MEHQKLYGLPDLNMNIIQMDKVTLSSSWKAVNIRSSFTRVYMVIEGIGCLRYGETNLRMIPGNVYIIPAGLTFSYDCENDFSKIYFHLSTRQPGGYDIFQGFDRCLQFSDTEGIELVKSNLDCDTVVKMTQIKAYLYALVCKCMQHKEDIKITEYSDYVTEIMKFVGKNLSANLTVEKIAEALFTSPGKLRKTFYKETGIPIGKYIDDRIMYTAELEVGCGNLSIKEISDLLGFCDQFYFSRCFSKKYGISPLKYRKEQMVRQSGL